MNFDFTEEQLALESTLQRFLERDYSFEQRRKLLNAADDERSPHWSTFAELGLLALPIEEAYGGLGGGPVDTYVVFRSLGRGLVIEPYLSSIILGAGLVQALGTEEQKAEILSTVASGEHKLALAHYEPHARHNESRVRCEALAVGDGWQLSGHKTAVLEAGCADYLLVSARHDGHVDSENGVSLFMVERHAAGVTLKGWRNHDGTQAAEVLLDKVQVGAQQRLGPAGAALPAIRWAIALGNAALVAEASGIMRALLNTTLEYLKTRKQFGVPLSSFQALQHRLADMAIATEMADAMALRAAISLQGEDRASSINMVSGAKAYVAEQARKVAQEAVQLHGGIGVTDELDVAHYFKRITTINMLLGDSDYHLQRYAETMEANSQ